MIDFLRSWIFNIVFLAIFIVLIEMLIPSGKTKKVVNLVSGCIMLIAIINPLLGIVGRDIDMKGFQIETGNFIDRKEIEAQGKILEEERMKQIVKLYREKIVSQLEGSAMEVSGVAGANADVVINEDYGSDKFGEIKKAYVRVRLQKENDGIKPVAKVGKIVIDKQERTNEEPLEMDNDIKRQMEGRIGSLFNLSSEDIVITLMEGMGG
ncbi:stage III sporulation protein AF [Anaerobacterium chartisolvens]|uniref:Stage III sporulation protein AF n=1 Tax=Anaerobacterium chartisolvens TaxID=1297424 RepID=A0A369BAT8_9FIRM|nr:stage III sporulation protein AF [Anaerobacterium chartisolvens]RCX16794.1 stage III sporulation protein AF [Anaerobacterium chartisolvens]